MTDRPTSEFGPLPQGVRSRFVDGVNGLRIHLLEAGDASPQPLFIIAGLTRGRPC